jgi:hypothetical protein
VLRKKPTLPLFRLTNIDHYDPRNTPRARRRILSGRQLYTVHSNVEQLRYIPQPHSLGAEVFDNRKKLDHDCILRTMLKPLTQPRASPASSPNFRYAPASRSLPGSPSTRRDSKSKPQGLPSKPVVANRVQYVDAGTQWSPMMNSKMESPPTEPAPVEAPPPQQSEASAPPIVTPAPRSPTKLILQPESPAMKRRQSQDVPTAIISSNQPLPTKRAKSDQTTVKVLPSKYEFCPVEDMVVIISNMISELIETNDQLPLRSGVLTRFHSR